MQYLYKVHKGVGLPYQITTPNGAIVAYSVRRIYPYYQGYAVEVRRSTDNATLNIGFIGNNLDTVTLANFCGAGNGTVRTWYDQSGNGYNAIQLDPVRQPSLVTAGAVNTINSRPTVTFSLALSTYLSAFAPVDIKPRNTMVVESHASFGASAAIRMYSKRVTDFVLRSNTYKYQIGGGTNPSRRTIAGTGAALNVLQLGGASWDGTANGSGINMYVNAQVSNGTIDGTGTLPTSNAAYPLIVGASMDTTTFLPGEHYDGNLSEILMYNSPLPDDTFVKSQQYLLSYYNISGSQAAYYMNKVHTRPDNNIQAKNLATITPTAPLVVVQGPGLQYETPIPSVTFTINYFTTNTVLTTFAPGGPFNSRPRINTFRSDGSFVTVLTSTSSITVTMPMTTTYIPYFTAGIDLFFGDWQYCKIEPTNTGWINRPGTLNPGESALQFTIDVLKDKPGVGRVTTWNNKAFTFNVTVSSPGIPAISTPTTISIQAPNGTCGTAIPMVATVNNNLATGNVKFYNSGALLGTSTLNSGTATLNNTFNTGTYNSLSAVYSGDTLFTSSSSSTISINITAIPTSTVLNVSNAAILSGEYMTLSAYVTPAVSVGNVTFTSDIDGTLSAVKVLNGTSVYSLSTLSIGTHSFVASYGGSGCNGGSSGSGSGTVSDPTPILGAILIKSGPVTGMPWA